MTLPVRRVHAWCRSSFAEQDRLRVGMNLLHGILFLLSLIVVFASRTGSPMPCLLSRDLARPATRRVLAQS